MEYEPRVVPRVQKLRALDAGAEQQLTTSDLINKSAGRVGLSVPPLPGALDQFVSGGAGTKS